MIGPKKLSAIRADITKAISSSSSDAIRRLEQQIATAKQNGASAEVMESLKRFLASGGQKKNRKRRTKAQT